MHTFTLVSYLKAKMTLYIYIYILLKFQNFDFENFSMEVMYAYPSFYILLISYGTRYFMIKYANFLASEGIFLNQSKNVATSDFSPI